MAVETVLRWDDYAGDKGRTLRKRGTDVLYCSERCE